MLAEGDHTGIEARVVRLNNGDIENLGDDFTEHQIQHDVFEEDGQYVHQSECYLEIEDGLEFAIVVKLHPPIHEKCFSHWSILVWVDGRLLSHQIDMAKGHDKERVFHQIYFKKGRKQMKGGLKFGKLMTTALADEVSMNEPDEVGLIRVSVQAGKRGAKCRAAVLDPEPEVNIAIEEKAKGLSSVIESNGVVTAAESFQYYAWIPRPDGKFEHEFIFNYRTKAMLELLNVTPPPPCPPEGKTNAQAGGSIQAGTTAPETQILEGDQQMRQEFEVMRRRMGEQGRQLTEMRRTISRLQDSTSTTKKQVIDLTEDDSE